MGDDEAALLLFKQCLDLDPTSIDALLSAEKDPVTQQTVRALLRADQKTEEVENGFGVGALELLADAASDDQTEDVLPQSIGPYRVIRMAGAGGTAIVYEAMEAVPRRRVAVKVARATLDPDLHPRFEAEAQALSNVRDEAVPVVYQVGSMVGLPWLAMEWVEGNQLVPDAVPNPLQTLIAVARGLAAAHEAGITHGDLSPANVLLTQSGPKLVDFGLAGSGGTSGPTGGTEGYRSDAPLSPEHADQYALGCLIRACNHETDDALQAIASSAISLQYPAIRDVWMDLCNRRDDRPIVARPDTPARSLMRRIRRFRSPIIGIVTTALVGIAIVGSVQQVQRRNEAVSRQQQDAEAMSDLEAVLALPPTELADALGHWLDDPRWTGTSAVGRAWLHRAQLLHQAKQHQASEDAAAQAFVIATRSQDKDQAAELLAAQFRRDARWSSLLRLAIRTDSSDWRMAALAGQRDLASAAEAAQGTSWFDLLSEWSTATRTDHKPTFIRDFPDSEHLLLSDQEAGFFHLVVPSATLPIVASAAMGPNAGRGGLPRVVDNAHVLENGREGTTVISRLSVHQNTLVRTHPVKTHDSIIATGQVDNGGLSTMFVGYGYPHRDLLALTGDGPEVAHEATSAAKSDVGPLLGVALPDGTPGLIAAAGPWRAYDLRLFRAQGPLQLIERQEMGTVTALATIRTDPLTIAVGTSDKYGNSVVLGTETPFGTGRGISLLEVTSTGFIERGFYSGEDVFQANDTLRAIIPGDFDGDGLTDLAVRLATSRGSVMWVLHNTGDGYDTLVIDDVVPLYAINVDDDPADELMARVNNDNYHLWTFGSGPQGVPALPDTPLAPPIAEDVPEALTAVTQLSELGLDRAAATLAEHRTAGLAQNDQPIAHYLQGLLWERAGDDVRAEAQLQAALELYGGSNDEVRVELAGVQASQLKFSEARDTLAAVATASSAPLRGRLDLAGDFPVETLRFPDAFSAMTLHNVDGIRTPVVGPHVDLDVLATGGDLFSADLDIVSNEFSVSYELDFRRVELATGLFISLDNPGGKNGCPGTTGVPAEGEKSTWNLAVPAKSSRHWRFIPSPMNSTSTSTSTSSCRTTSKRNKPAAEYVMHRVPFLNTLGPFNHRRPTA